MGPLAGAELPIYVGNGDDIRATMDNRERHRKCRESANCTGPGCKVKTGKTSEMRKPA